MLSIISFILTGLLLYEICDSAKILVVVPSPAISHQVPFRPLTEELAKRGHEVFFITTHPAYPKGQTPLNLTEIDIQDSLATWVASAEQMMKEHQVKQSTGTVLMGKQYFLQSVKMVYTSAAITFDAQMKNKNVQELLSAHHKFDLLILEAWVRPTLVFSHLYKAPVILFSSLGAMLGNYEAMGAPVHPLLCSMALRTRLYNLTIWEKINELYNYFSFQWFYMNHEEYENKLLKNIFGPETPKLSELAKNVDMMFLNQYSVWEGNWPIPSSVINVGGIHLTNLRVKPLPEDILSYLEKSINGVVYVSFGTNVIPSQIGEAKIKTMLKTFENIPYDVLWKYDADELPWKAKNVKIAKWFPQFDMLHHPNVTLFITQGGLQSTDEAILAGVPLIGIPMLGDQWYNTEKYVYHKVGIQLDIDSLTEEQFRDAITTVIQDKSYRNNVLHLRRVMQDQPQNGLERAVWWTEHVLRHKGARHLRAPAANMSWSEYYELELVGYLLLTAITIAVTVLYLYTIKKLIIIFFKSKSTSTKLKRS